MSAIKGAVAAAAPAGKEPKESRLPSDPSSLLEMAGEITETGELYSPYVGLVYMFNLIVGTGALTMPKAFATAGWLVSLVLLVFLGFMSFVTTTFVVEAMAAANAQLHWKRMENHQEEEDDDSSTASDSDVLVQDNYERAEKRPILSVQRRGSLNLFEITDRVEMGQMASMFFNKVGVNLFYFCIIIYLYGDLAIYAAAVPFSLMQVTCSATGNESCGVEADSKHNDTDPCWGPLRRVDAYRIYLGLWLLKNRAFRPSTLGAGCPPSGLPLSGSWDGLANSEVSFLGPEWSVAGGQMPLGHRQPSRRRPSRAGSADGRVGSSCLETRPQTDGRTCLCAHAFQVGLNRLACVDLVFCCRTSRGDSWRRETKLKGWMGEGPAASPSWLGWCLKPSSLSWQSPLPRQGSARALDQPLTGLGLQKVAAGLCPVGEPPSHGVSCASTDLCVSGSCGL
uniref:transmembrane protein 104 isoform X5 n=1 Tax=Halichoerus grypus TaxID=9711 RepID=UPI00165978CC|nr:transmembrane protein 104 isoform X5 [Halichoerus grypus]